MLNMQQHPSAIARLRSQLAAGHIANVSDFWRDAESLNGPLVMPVEGAEDEREVTFLWRAWHSLQGVYLRLNRVTDKEHVAKGMMTPLPETDIWTLTLRLPASYCGSYSLIEIPLGTPAKRIAQAGGRFAALPGHADPLNKTPRISVRGSSQESVLTLDKAPAQPEWSGGSPTGQLLTSSRIIAGQSRRVQLYMPDVDVLQPLGLVVLPDGETWFDHLGVCAAIDVAINNGRIVPVAIMGIDNIDEHERNAILGGRSELITDIARHLLPTIRAEQPQRQWADRSRTVLAGQSLGGVSALIAARHAPETFGLALSHSFNVVDAGRRLPAKLIQRNRYVMGERASAFCPTAECSYPPMRGITGRFDGTARSAASSASAECWRRQPLRNLHRWSRLRMVARRTD